MSINQFSLLKTKRFLPLFITQFLGAFNDNVFKNALVILITYRIAEIENFNPQILVTLAAGIFILPFFLFSATAGQLADKYERSRLIAIIKFAEIILMGLAAAALYLHSVTLLMVLLFLIGIQATFFGPLKFAILPDQLQEHELVAGNALVEAGTFLAILTGTIFGGLFILNIHGITIISLIIIAIAIIGWISSLYIPRVLSMSPELKINWNFLTETYRVVKYSQQQKNIFLAILGISWFWLIGAIFLSEFSVYAKDILNANQEVVTLFFTLFSLGIGIGSLLCNRALKGKVYTTTVPLGALGMTLFMLDFYFASRYGIHSAQLMGLMNFLLHASSWRICIDLLMIAICGGLYIVPLYAYIQQYSEETHRARIIASNNIINSLFMVIAALATMLMLAIGLSVIQIFLMIAIINAFVAIYICKLLPETLIKSFVKWLLQAIYRVKVVGIENYDSAGDRLLIIANHTSFLDAALLAAFLPDKLTFAVNTHVAQKWWLRLFLTMVNAFPMDPANPMSIKSLIHYVSQNKKCVIFPEGRITVTGTLMKIYEGPGLVADKSGAKLLPVRIDGAQFTPFSRLRGKVHLHWAPTITITILPPCEFHVPENYKGRKRRHYVGNKLYDLMTYMLFQSSAYKETLFTGLLAAKTIHGANHIVAEDIERKPLTYSQLILRAFLLGNLISRTTKHNEAVGILLPNTLATLSCFFALHVIGRVPAMLNFSTGANSVVIACESAQIKQIYTSKKFISTARLEGMIEKIAAIGCTIHYLENLRDKFGLFAKSKAAVMSLLPHYFYHRLSVEQPKLYKPDPNSPAVILFTSGSEGTPKGVALSHKNIQANRFQLSACVDFTPVDIVFNALPLFHSFGLTGGMLLPVLSGLKVFLYPSPLHYRIIPELSYDTNATIIFGTDTFLSGYAKLAHPYDFYSLRYVFAGAERLKEETRKLWSEKFGVRIFEGYGATEASPVITTNTPMHNRPGTVGRFLPAIQYQLEEVQGIEEGQRLFIKGPNIMLGYLRVEHPGIIDPPAEGWYDTGDIISMDNDGYLKILGRAKRFAKIGGEMISLPAVENYLNTLWPTHQHAVISITDAKKGEQLVLATTNTQATREEILNFIKAKSIPEIMVPKKIVTLDSLPLLGTGKTDYVAIATYINAMNTK